MSEYLNGNCYPIVEDNVDYINWVRDDMIRDNNVILMNKYILIYNMSEYYIFEIN